LKLVLLALALFCSGTSGECQLVESNASPHAEVTACQEDLARETATIRPDDLDGLIRQGGYFSAACVEVPEDYKASDHAEELADRLGRPTKFNHAAMPRIDS